jgi:hypothetical protein
MMIPSKGEKLPTRDEITNLDRGAIIESLISLIKALGLENDQMADRYYMDMRQHLLGWSDESVKDELCETIIKLIGLAK